MKIVALDLGKSKMVGCMYDTLTHEHRFDSAPLDRGTLRTALEAERPDRVVIEIGSTAGWVGDVVRAHGAELEVANPSHQGWRWRNVKKKTDRMDALKLAQLSATNQLPKVHLPEAGVRQWRGLIHYRHHQVRRRTAIKNRIRAILNSEGIDMAEGKRGWGKQQLQTVRQMARPWEDVDPKELWRGELSEELAQYDQVTECIVRVEKKLDELAASDARVTLLRTIPGVGPRLAEAVVAIIDDPHRFKRGKQVGSYCGLVPRQFQSGSMDRHGRITGAGDRMLRALLVEVSWIALRYNPWALATFDRICQRKKGRRKTAIIAVARRLVVRCWAMLRDHTTWSPPACVEVVSDRAGGRSSRG
jgi:transposase